MSLEVSRDPPISERGRLRDSVPARLSGCTSDYPFTGPTRRTPVAVAALRGTHPQVTLSDLPSRRSSPPAREESLIISNAARGISNAARGVRPQSAQNGGSLSVPMVGAVAITLKPASEARRNRGANRGQDRQAEAPRGGLKELQRGGEELLECRPASTATTTPTETELGRGSRPTDVEVLGAANFLRATEPYAPCLIQTSENAPFFRQFVDKARPRS